MLLLFIFIYCKLQAAVLWPSNYDHNPIDPVEFGGDFEVNGIFYKIIDSENQYVSTVEGDKLYSGKIVIPDEVQYDNRTYKVTKISGFLNSPDVTEITIPKYVTCISGFYAAPEGQGMESMVGGDGSSDWGDKTEKFSKLKTIYFNADNCQEAYYYIDPSGSVSGYYCYQSAFPKSVTEIKFGDNVTNIPRGLLYFCSNITSIVFPESIKYIGSDIISSNYDNLTSCILNCEDLQQLFWTPKNSDCIKLGDNFHTLPCEKYYNMSALFKPTSNSSSILELPNIKRIAPRALRQNYGFETVIFNKLEEIGKEALCEGENIIINGNFPDNSLLTVGESALCNISNLIISGKEIQLDNNAMRYVKNLEINCDELYSPNFSFANTERCLWNVGKINNDNYYTSLFNDKLVEVILGENVEILPRYIFSKCTGIRTITFPQTLHTIDAGSFEGCTSLTNVIFPETVKVISSNAFKDCTSITSIELNSSLEKIENNAFSGCNIVEAFIDCPNCDMGTFGNEQLKTIILGEHINSLYLSSPYIKELYLPYPINEGQLNCPGLESVKFGKNFTVIPERFLRYSPLKKIEFEGALLELGQECFSAAQVSKVVLPSSLLKLGYNSFNFNQTEELEINSVNCEWSLIDLSENTRKLTIGEGVKYLPPIYTSSSDLNLFYNAINAYYIELENNNFLKKMYAGEGIKNVKIGDKVEVLPKCFMFGNIALTEITIPESVKFIDEYAFGQCTFLKSINILNDDTKLSVNVFSDCTALENVTLPSNLTEIPGGTFQNCSSLTSVDIPTAVTVLGGYAFDGCSALETIVIPENVVSIYGSFSTDCNSLRLIESKALTPPSCQYGNEFLGVNIDKCELIVPEGSLEKYKAALTWRDFYNVSEAGLDVITIGSDYSTGAIYNIKGQKIGPNDIPASGIYIFKNGSIAKKVLK